MFTVNDPLIAPSRGSPLQAIAWFASHGAKRMEEVDSLIREFYRLGSKVGLDAATLTAQAAEETGNFTNKWWIERLNSGSIGITGDPTENEASQTWTAGRNAAQGHIAHMIAYTYQSLPWPTDGPSNWIGDNGKIETFLGTPPLYHVDQRFYHAVRAIKGEAKTIRDLTGKWATDSRYAEQIVANANAIFGGTTTMPPNQYQVVGLPNPITLSFPLAHDIIGPIQVRQRPGIVRITPGYWIQHETDNHAAGADAEMHARYLDSGADGRQASWHFTVDDGMAYQHIPVDEVTWQAADGNGPGNMSGVSCELCVNNGSDQIQARHNAEELCAQVCKALGLGSDRVKRHWDFNEKSADRHHCPDTMMSDGYWSTFVANVTTLLTPPPPPPPVYANPKVPDWFGDSVRLDAPSDADVNGTRWYVVRRNFQALKNAQRYSEPRTTAPKSGPKINVRDKVRAERQFTAKDDKGRNRTWLVLPDGSFVTAASFNPNVIVRAR